jgi:hypothetical protein
MGDSISSGANRRRKEISKDAVRTRTRKERDYYQYGSRDIGVAAGATLNGGGRRGDTSWSTIACVFISITLLLATALGGILYQSYEARVKAHSRDMFLDAKGGGAAEAFLFLRDSDKRSSVGVVRFYAEDENVRVVAELTNLKANTEHAFHIYQYTDPVDNDIGEILNPKKKSHGCPGITAEYCMGDLGNVKVNALGVAMYDGKMVGATIADIIGRSVVIHENKDDCLSQPRGNSGDFLAEGVISLGNPAEMSSKLPADKADGRVVLPKNSVPIASIRNANSAPPEQKIVGTGVPEGPRSPAPEKRGDPFTGVEASTGKETLRYPHGHPKSLHGQLQESSGTMGEGGVTAGALRGAGHLRGSGEASHDETTSTSRVGAEGSMPISVTGESHGKTDKTINTHNHTPKSHLTNRAKDSSREQGSREEPNKEMQHKNMHAEHTRGAMPPTKIDRARADTVGIHLSSSATGASGTTGGKDMGTHARTGTQPVGHRGVGHQEKEEDHRHKGNHGAVPSAKAHHGEFHVGPGIAIYGHGEQHKAGHGVEVTQSKTDVAPIKHLLKELHASHSVDERKKKLAEVLLKLKELKKKRMSVHGEPGATKDAPHPSGTGSGSPPGSHGNNAYTVRPGDTVDSVAHTFHMTRQEIVELNPRAAHGLTPGSVIAMKRDIHRNSAGNMFAGSTSRHVVEKLSGSANISSGTSAKVEKVGSSSGANGVVGGTERTGGSSGASGAEGVPEDVGGSSGPAGVAGVSEDVGGSSGASGAAGVAGVSEDVDGSSGASGAKGVSEGAEGSSGAPQFDLADPRSSSTANGGNNAAPGSSSVSGGINAHTSSGANGGNDWDSSSTGGQGPKEEDDESSPPYNSEPSNDHSSGISGGEDGAGRTSWMLPPSGDSNGEVDSGEPHGGPVNGVGRRRDRMKDASSVAAALGKDHPAMKRAEESAKEVKSRPIESSPGEPGNDAAEAPNPLLGDG